ncbi:MAG TPA: tetratricopeptide repeat protein [Pirellulales bacterium]|jgi:tetratricopeptide (TPR) repeat protein
MKPRTKAHRKQQAVRIKPATYLPDAPTEPRSRRAAAAGLLLALVVVAYLPVVRAGFIWDDESYVENNEALHTFDGLRRIWFDKSTERQYYPLVHTTFWIEYHLWGLHPLGYHLINVSLHALSAVLLWRLLVRLRVPGAWLAAALFAVHPVMVESVAWVTERKNVLSLALALLSLHAYLRFAPADDDGRLQTARPRDAWRWYALALVLFLAALLSKTVVASLPAVILVIYWWKRGRITPQDMLPLVPFFALGLGLGLFTVWMEKHHVGARGSEFDFTVFERILIAGRAAWFYVGKLVWPYPLAFFYPRFAIDDHALWQYIFPLTAVALLITLWWYRERIGRGPLAAVLVFGGVLVPALGFFNVYPFRYSFVADHFQYHASLALFALAGAGAMMAAARLPQQFRAAAPAAGGLLLAVLVMLSFSQARTYRDLETLYHDTIAKNPSGWTAYSNLAVYVEALGRHDEAYENFKKAVELNPDDEKMQANMGHILLKLGERDGFTPELLEEMMGHFRRALEIDPNSVSARRGLGFALVHANRPNEAIEQFSRTLKLRPNDPDSWTGRAAVLGAAGQSAEAERSFRRALELDPNYVEALRGLAILCMQQKRTAEAIQYLEKVVQLRPKHPDAQYELANQYALRKNFQGAANHYAVAVSLRPKFVEGWIRLGAAYGDLNQFDKAIDCFQQALLLDPTSVPAQANLQKAQELKAKPAAAP